MTMLMGASLGGQEALVISLIERRADVNARAADGATALMAAACSGAAGDVLVRRLLASGADASLIDQHGTTAAQA